MSAERDYSPPLDLGIAEAVHVLNDAGIQTFESCEGGAGHCFAEPTVRFYGERPEGWKALAAVLYRPGLRVAALRRVWSINDGEPDGPYWELVFTPRRGS